MKKFYSLFLLLLAVFVLNAQTQLTEAQDFSVKDLDGETIHLFEILGEGNFVVIDFFSTSCGPCAEYAPQIQASYEDFGSNSGNVFFMGISWGDDNIGVEHFDSVYGITYPSVSGFEGGGNEVVNMYGIQSYPTVILIHPDGTILNQYIWEPTTENINQAIIEAGGIPVGTEEFAEKNENFIKFFPNPVKDVVYLQYKFSEGKEIQLEIYNVLGSLVHSKKLINFVNNNTAELSLRNLNEGSYFIRLIKDNRVISTERLIVAR